MKTSNMIFTKACMVLAATALVNVSCTDDFLKQDPLSFYNPENVVVFCLMHICPSLLE